MQSLTLPSTDVSFIASQALARSQQPGAQPEAEGDTDASADAMAKLERQARAPVGFVPASTGPQGGKAQDAAPPAATNPDAIDVDDEEEE